MATTNHPKRSWILPAIGSVCIAVYGYIKMALLGLGFLATIKTMPADLTEFWNEWIVPLGGFIVRMPLWGRWVGGLTTLLLSFALGKVWDRLYVVFAKSNQPPINPIVIQPTVLNEYDNTRRRVELSVKRATHLDRLLHEHIDVLLNGIRTSINADKFDVAAILARDAVQSTLPALIQPLFSTKEYNRFNDFVKKETVKKGLEADKGIAAEIGWISIFNVAVSHLFMMIAVRVQERLDKVIADETKAAEDARLEFGTGRTDDKRTYLTEIERLQELINRIPEPPDSLVPETPPT